jgi:hypothetical protein
MTDSQSAAPTVIRQASGNSLATGGVVALFGTFGGLAIGVLLTLAIGAAITWGGTSRLPVGPANNDSECIGQERLMAILKAERDAHRRRDTELEDRFESLRNNVAEWQAYVEKTRCHCRHTGVGAAAELAPPKESKALDSK